LRVKAHFNINIVEKIPIEMKTSHLPLSYYFYDAVPSMMAKNLAQFDFKEDDKDDKEEDLA
jgi:hypothetical protein